MKNILILIILLTFSSFVKADDSLRVATTMSKLDSLRALVKEQNERLKNPPVEQKLSPKLDSLRKLVQLDQAKKDSAKIVVEDTIEVVIDSLETERFQKIFFRNNYKRKDSLLVSIISKEEIENSFYQTLGDILDKEIGFNSIGLGEVGRHIGLRSKGGKIQHTKVLLNGIPFSLLGTGLTDLNKIPVTEIERIEFSTHGNSALYGSGAISGWINVVTKEYYPLKPKSKIALERGGYRYRNVDLLIGGRIARNLWGSASGTIKKTKGYTLGFNNSTKSSYEGQKVSINLLYDFNQDWYLKLYGLYNKTELNIPQSLDPFLVDLNNNTFYSRPDYSSKFSSGDYFDNFEEEYHFHLKTEGKFLHSTDDDFKGDLWFYNGDRTLAKDVESLNSISRTEMSVNKFGGRTSESIEINELGYTEHFTSEIGIDGELVWQNYDLVPNDSIPQIESKSGNFGIFFANSTRLNKNFSVYGSIRRDFYKASDKFLSNSGSIFLIKTTPFDFKDFWIETAAANNFRNPSLVDLRFNGLRFFSDKNLKSEKNNEIWASLNFKNLFFEKTRLEYFDTIVKHSIVYTEISDTTTTVNVSNSTKELKYRGIELAFENAEFYKFNFGFGADYFFASDEINFPDLTFKWQIGYKDKFFNDNLKVFVNLSGETFSRGKRQGFDFESATYFNTNSRSPLNSVVNANIRAIISDFELFYNFINIGNVNYFEVKGYPELPYQTHWGIRWVFND
ncbi:MAG: hypothetical protein DWQ06_12615 [Calditrichaeota bacterium]|nr:MAG: hypothetical protein DWQ06_12615 [Calditrichota bacterium]